MNMNMGKLDRMVRIILGGILFLAFLQGTVVGPLAVAAIIVSAILMLTAIVGSCPLYTLLGLKTFRY